MKSKLLLLELNELNFEYIEKYIAQGRLPTFERLLGEHGFQRTTSEQDYDNLEPWIQWVTAHTGLDYGEHGIFRLGDIVEHDLPQIWDDLEQKGLNVGAISPMNARQRMRAPAFFLPDPWTKAPMVAPGIVQRFYRVAARMVNQNAEGGGVGKSLGDLGLGLAYCARLQNYGRYLKYAAGSRAKTWNRALVLDLVLADLFVKLVKRRRPDFASLFLNSAAHIQHHYMFSSSAYQGNLRNPDWYVRPGEDPVYDVYELYDHILASICREFPGYRIMIATGLHQVPYPETSFYWRLKDHEAFLREVGVPFTSIEPRMSRDFLVECRDAEQALSAAQRLGMVCDLDRQSMFEVDNRGSSLFVTLSYRHEIKKDMRYLVGNEERTGIGDAVAFVAIKNGHHDGIGYFLDTGGERPSPDVSFPLKELPEKIRAVVL
ncbi:MULTISPECIES: alkaline phosphatase family protein [unclassified Sphingomonas]|uniref:alkaline phosphatase family protein n=8 Tax=Pseudomonadota TaxID=1224 RepID=UPI0014851C2C|nr:MULTISPECIES: alkaline phosphatase family protein [unclassified Sphingomonas]